jgi:hypothetical protein
MVKWKTEIKRMKRREKGKTLYNLVDQPTHINIKRQNISRLKNDIFGSVLDISCEIIIFVYMHAIKDE